MGFNCRHLAAATGKSTNTGPDIQDVVMVVVARPIAET
jgi:hypothetical protein